MNKIYLEYFNGYFNQQEVDELSAFYNDSGISIEIHERQPCFINAAFDELVADILLFITSQEVQTTISILNFVAPIAKMIKYIYNKFKMRKAKKISANSIEEREPNIIIEVDTIKILIPKDTTEEELTHYLCAALDASKKISQNEDELLIIEENDLGISIYTLLEFAERKMSAQDKKEK